MVRSLQEIPVHGRIILVSADAGSVKQLVFVSHRKSFLRQMVAYDNNSDIGLDVEDTMGYSIPLMSACVLSTKERAGAKDFMVSKMSGIPFEEYVVRYTPSLSSRLFGVDSEMSALSGRQLFLERFGINMENMNSIGDIVKMLRKDTLETMSVSDSRSRQLTLLQKTLLEFVKDAGSCPICLDSYDLVSKTSLINPCWHIFCNECVSKLLKNSDTKCPMCRTDIEGHTVALNTRDESAATKAPEAPEERPRESATLVENLRRVVDPSMGLDRVCLRVIRCIESDVRNGGVDGCYRIIMVVPDDHFFARFSDSVEEEIGKGVLDMIRFQAVGDKRKRVTSGSLDKNIEDFGSGGGSRVKILFTTEGRTDSLTGLDFPNVDCMFSVGYGNNMQRLGRLTRIPRFINDGYIQRTNGQIYISGPQFYGSTIRRRCRVG